MLIKSNLVLSYKDSDVPGGVLASTTNLEAIDCKLETHQGHTSISLMLSRNDLFIRADSVLVW